jgi:hypothetical protein
MSNNINIASTQIIDIISLTLKLKLNINAIIALVIKVIINYSIDLIRK